MHTQRGDENMRVEVTTRKTQGRYAVTQFDRPKGKHPRVLLHMGAINEGLFPINRAVAQIVQHEAFHYNTPRTYRQNTKDNRKRREAQERLAERFAFQR
jgi:hypothetical protein